MPPISTTMTVLSHRRFPGLRLRPARSYDFPLMARMANEIFQHERDIDHFNKHHCVKMGCEAEASAADRLLAAESDWRLENMLRNRRKPGRQFIVASYIKEPADFLMRRHGAHSREELLGWAEWQDPGSMSDEPVRNGDLSDSNQREAAKHGGKKAANGSAHGKLESILKSLTFVHEGQPLLVPPNGLAVRLPDALESFQRAGTNDIEGWKRWSKQIIPACFGQTGDAQGRHLVLRSLVINTTHWDHSIGYHLLKWGMLRANVYGWDIQTLASSINVSTLDSFRDAGFKELGRLDIFRDTQIVLGWQRVQESKKRVLETSDSEGHKRGSQAHLGDASAHLHQ